MVILDPVHKPGIHLGKVHITVNSADVFERLSEQGPTELLPEGLDYTKIGLQERTVIARRLRQIEDKQSRGLSTNVTPFTFTCVWLGFGRCSHHVLVRACVWCVCVCVCVCVNIIVFGSRSQKAL